MSSSYRRTIAKLNEQGGDPDNLPCLRCKTPTARFTLSHCGGRCQGCFDDYCREGNPVDLGWQRRLTPTQIERAALEATEHERKPEGPREATPEQREAAKRETDRKVAEYAKRNGLSLADSATLLQGGRKPTPEKPYDEPAWIRQGAER